MALNYPKRTISRVETNTGGDALTYEPYFGLAEKPFSLVADPRFVYSSPTYAAARQGLLAGIRRREGLLVLTGEIGTGKTTLCRAVLADLGRHTYSSLVPDPFASREDLLKMLLIDFGVVSIQDVTTGPLRQASRTELGYLLSDFIESLPPDAFVVVMIDEAQNLSLPLIEETRLLSDTFGAKGRLQTVFVGQPELHAKLKLPEMRQVDQRVCGYHRLAPMDLDSVAGYLQHRLQAAGCHPGRVLFPPEIVGDLHRRTGGVPRLVNRVGDRALQLAYERRAERVDREVLDTALLEIGSTTLSPTWDSIIFAAPPTKAPDAAPAVLPIDKVDAALPPVADADSFEMEIDQWVAQELAPPPPPLTRRHAAVPADAPIAPAPQRSAARTATKTAARREPPARTVTTDWPRGTRSETYLHRLLRTWAKVGGIALVLFVLLNAAIVGASRLQDLLAAPSLPALPAAPAVSGVVLPDAPLPYAPAADVPVAAGTLAPAASGAASSVDYFVAVGLFADRARADQILETLSAAGLPAMQRPFELRRQQVQQVVLGPYFSRSDAVADLRRLQALGGYRDATVTNSQ